MPTNKEFRNCFIKSEKIQSITSGSTMDNGLEILNHILCQKSHVCSLDFSMPLKKLITLSVFVVSGECNFIIKDW